MGKYVFDTFYLRKICKSIGETLDVYRHPDSDNNDLHIAVNNYNLYKNLPDKNSIQEPFKSWFEKDKKMKLLPIEQFPAEGNWYIDNFWTEEEKIEIGFKEADNTMTLGEFQTFLDDVINDIRNYKEAIECLKQ